MEQTNRGGMESEDEAGFRRSWHGEILTPDDPGYDDARRLYNGAFDKRPALVAQCADEQDVIRAVKYARGHGLELAIRGGGHNGAGLGSVDRGLVVDLRRLNRVRVDPARRIATAQGGALLRDLDEATHEHGLATPAGIFGTTGIGGLTLGGGHGYLTRKYGLAVDNLLSAEVVLADGTSVTASESHHPDLFWALRGGGGNFGVVTSFTFRLHPVANVVGGPTLWPVEAAGELLSFYREFLPDAPEDLFGFFAFLVVPPAPPFPAELHGKTVCGIVWCWTGSPGDAAAAMAPALAVAKPALHGVQELPYTMLQSVFDALYPPGQQWYWRGDFADAIPDGAVAAHVAFGSRLPTPGSSMHIYPIDGAVHRIAPDATAFAFRDATFSQVIVGVDPDPAKLPSLRSWVVDYWQALHPYSAGGAYVNFLMDEGEQRVRASYRDNLERLARVKAKYDPDNLFHVNQNIRPAGG